jgi:hypothetical protein
MLIAFLLWTLPNWGIFTQNAAQFSTLWQVETNRSAIIILVIKVCSPLLTGLLISACIWLWYLIKPYLPEASFSPGQAYLVQTPAQTRSVPGQKVAVQADARTSGSAEVLPPTVSTPSPRPAPQALSPEKRFPQPDPVTPVPMLDDLPPLTREPQPNNAQAAWGNASEHKRPLSPRAAALQQRRYQRLYRTSTPQVKAPSQAEQSSTAQPLPPSPSGLKPPGSASPKRPETPEQEEDLPSPRPRCDTSPRAYEVVITLLKQVSMTLVTDQGISREVPLSLNAKRVQLLAYLAWQRGQPVNRDRMLEQVFGHGRDDEEATREKLGEAFDSHKKLIRWDLREAVNQLNTEAGRELIPPDLDIFAHKQRLYWLSDVCRVTDLEAIEAEHQVIEQARKDGLLIDQIPEQVKAACDRLLDAYSGDFLEDLVTDYLDDFEPWVSSWARKPYTHFRDLYLQALWYAAEYELKLGQQSADERLDTDGEANRKEQRKHWDLAAQHYRTYAMYACNSRFDQKVTFGGAGREAGERVIMSERALRRSVVLYGAIGATHLVDQVYSAYYKQMRSISAKAWEPSKETLADLRAAKEQTNAYRFPKQVTPHELVPSMGNHLETSA